MDTSRPGTCTATAVAVLAALCALAWPGQAHANQGKADPPAVSARADDPSPARDAGRTSARPTPPRNARASGPPVHANASEHRSASVSPAGTSEGSNPPRTGPRRATSRGGGGDGTPGRSANGAPGSTPSTPPTSPSPAPDEGPTDPAPPVEADDDARERDRDPEPAGTRSGSGLTSATLLRLLGAELAPTTASTGFGAAASDATAAVLGPAPTTPTTVAIAGVPDILAPSIGLVPLPDGSATRAAEALADRTRAVVRGLPNASLPPRDLGISAAMLALLGAYLAALQWLDRGGLPMAHLDERRGDDVHLVL